MIISRTPFRISFFGGGTDYPAWYREHGGAVVSAAIDKYCYISARFLPPFFSYKTRVVWSRIEEVGETVDIQHPAVRATLEHLGMDCGLSIHHDADLPARSGLGSSSTFTVGMLHALYGLKGQLCSKQRLAEEAIHIEQRVLRENVGCQDQVIAAHGGFNKIEFYGEDQIKVSPLTLPIERQEALQSHLMLFFTGLSRTASDIAKAQIENIKNRKPELRAMYQMVDESLRILKDGRPMSDFGRLLHESWLIKKGLTDKISTSEIDAMYDAAMKAGALGGKILGAGGGGFLLVFAEREAQPRVREALGHYLHVPCRFSSGGSEIVYYRPDAQPTALRQPA